MNGILTVDVEDGINIGMRDLMGIDMPPTQRVLTNTRSVLDLFAEHNVKGTFFVLGQVAESYPQLIKDINAHGHEIGVHGYDHYQFFRMDPCMAKDQLTRARKILQDLTGQQIIGHRAPAFSINRETSWALPLLAEIGFKYDSSIMPCYGLNYGWENFNKKISKLRFNSGHEIYEFPMSTVKLLGKEMPCLGGSYLRLLPLWISKQSYKQVSESRNPIVFIHPYELDEERYPDYFFEALKGKSMKTKIRVLFMRLNRVNVKNKLSGMFEQYKFTTMNNILNGIPKNMEPINWDDLLEANT